MAPLSASAINAVGGGAPPDNSLFVTVSAHIPGAWVYSTQVTTASGSTSLGQLPRVCVTGDFNACATAVARLHLRQVVTYQPASRFWAFQWTETALYLLLALLLAGFCFWWASWRLSR